MEKVKLPKEVAEAIEKMLREGIVASDIVFDHVLLLHRNQAWPRFPQLNQISTDMLIRALYLGYEIKETPEDKVRKQFAYLASPNTGQCIEDAALKSAEADGIKFALNTLGIKIEGVNT
jgi:hypothetical protein